MILCSSIITQLTVGHQTQSWLLQAAYWAFKQSFKTKFHWTAFHYRTNQSIGSFCVIFHRSCTIVSMRSFCGVPGLSDVPDRNSAFNMRRMSLLSLSYAVIKLTQFIIDQYTNFQIIIVNQINYDNADWFLSVQRRCNKWTLTQSYTTRATSHECPRWRSTYCL